MIITLKAIEETETSCLVFSVENLETGWWGIYRDGDFILRTWVDHGNSLQWQHGFSSGQEVDFVFMRQ
jgi:hypothetical protein